jgi:hypothetical protein
MNQNYVPIEGESGFSKDPYSHAIVNTDRHALIEYKQKKKISAQIQSMQEEINMLKSELETIKSHLKLS